MYEVLMDLPLFQGVSHTKISELIEKIRFNFLKYLNNEKFISANDSCQQLRFLISGKARIEIFNMNRRIRVLETISGPNVIGAEYLFGKTTAYPYNVYAEPEAGILQIEKSDYLKIIKSDSVFLFNMLNYLSRNSQTPMEAVLSLTSGSIAERLAFWITSLTYRNATDIVIHSKHKDMYTMLGIQRSSFINTLSELKEKGYLDFDNSEIRITDRDKMFELMNSNKYKGGFSRSRLCIFQIFCWL